MKFHPYPPSPKLKEYIKLYVISEQVDAREYKVLPGPGMVMGFQYRGQLSAVKDSEAVKLASAGLTGLTDSYRLFRNADQTGSVLVYFTEVGFSHFCTHPANELFNLSLSLEDVFDKNAVAEVEEKLCEAQTDLQKIKVVEDFLLAMMKDIRIDKLVLEGVQLIYQSKGTLPVKELNKLLCISQSPFEKRFRKVVGATPKKFSSIIRLQSVLEQIDGGKSLTQICYENRFFDQAHFIKDFKQFTGETPEAFKRKT